MEYTFEPQLSVSKRLPAPNVTSSFKPPEPRLAWATNPANTHTELGRSTPHIPPMPGFGRAGVDRAGELDGRHLTANYQQAADLALDPANAGIVSAGRDSAARASN
jgi:hypothetical protein